MEVIIFIIIVIVMVNKAKKANNGGVSKKSNTTTTLSSTSYSPSEYTPSEYKPSEYRIKADERRRELGLPVSSDADEEDEVDEKVVNEVVNALLAKSEPYHSKKEKFSTVKHEDDYTSLFSSKNIKGLSGAMEDRSNDWLAKQLRQEKYLGQFNKYDLGAAHDVNCDARGLKYSHIHDDTIDNGELEL